MTPHLKIWDEKYANPGPRRLLAIDGGGIRGIMSLEILRRIETQLARQTGQGDAFRLGRYFDYIGGTSTGAIIATGLAVGMSVDELVDFYVNSGEKMFSSNWLLKRARALYTADPLRETLKTVLAHPDGTDRLVGADDLKCLLMVVTRNANTDSPWPVTNNPFARYNDPVRENCNLKIPLWDLVRASTAAPVYYPPEQLELDRSQTFTFVDGGVTPYNNPGYLLFRKATLPAYGLRWETGEDRMMLISVGTGSSALVDPDLGPKGQNLFKNAISMPGILMNGSAVDQDINCRMAGRCVFGAPIDRELGTMAPRSGDPVSGEELPLDQDSGAAFLYARYDPDISQDGLRELGLGQIDPTQIAAMDKVAYLPQMQAVGAAYGDRHVDMAPFARFAGS